MDLTESQWAEVTIFMNEICPDGPHAERDDEVVAKQLSERFPQWFSYIPPSERYVS